VKISCLSNIPLHTFNLIKNQLHNTYYQRYNQSVISIKEGNKNTQANNSYQRWRASFDFNSEIKNFIYKKTIPTTHLKAKKNNYISESHAI